MCVLDKIGNCIQQQRGKPPLSEGAKAVLFFTEIALVVIALVALIVVFAIRSHRSTKAAMAAEASKNAGLAAAGITVTPVPSSSLVKTKLIRTLVTLAIVIPVGACIGFLKSR